MGYMTLNVLLLDGSSVSVTGQQIIHLGKTPSDAVFGGTLDEFAKTFPAAMTELIGLGAIKYTPAVDDDLAHKADMRKLLREQLRGDPCDDFELSLQASEQLYEEASIAADEAGGFTEREYQDFIERYVEERTPV
jgi:uncharacterized NAD-dependent epimerase/dehydratase family protein